MTWYQEEVKIKVEKMTAIELTSMFSSYDRREITPGDPAEFYLYTAWAEIMKRLEDWDSRHERARGR